MYYCDIIKRNRITTYNNISVTKKRSMSD